MEKVLIDLRRCELFAQLSQEELIALVPCCEMKICSKGDCVFLEGDSGTDIFLILQGSVALEKKDAVSGQTFVQSVLNRYDVFGEMAFISGSSRITTATIQEPTQLLVIKLDRLSPAWQNKMRQAIQSQEIELLAQRLKKENELSLSYAGSDYANAQARKGLGNVLIYLMGLVFLYIYVTKFISILSIPLISSSVISVPILFIFAFFMLLLIRKNGLPLSAYGLTCRRGLRSFIESLLWTIPAGALIVLFKWLLINTVPSLAHVSLFHVSADLSPSSSASLAASIIFILVYAISIPIQEFIYRGVLQNCFEQFLTGKHKTLYAVLIANLPFSMIHLHLSFYLALILYLYGLFFSWLFVRQRTLIGCTVTHFLLGLWVFFRCGHVRFPHKIEVAQDACLLLA